MNKMNEIKTVKCIPVNKPGNILYKRYRDGIDLEISKARGFARKGDVIILNETKILTTAQINKAINKSQKCIFFIFVGELGYEILSSHGWLRKLKFEHPEITIGVASRAGVKFLYEGACDLYVDIKDQLSDIMSDCFGTDSGKSKIPENRKQLIEQLCRDESGRHGIQPAIVRCVYSSGSFSEYGIFWGRNDRVASVAYKDVGRFLQQKFAQLKLTEYGKEREILYSRFPQLKTERYCVLHDRRRSISWGNESFVSNEIWLEIIERLKKAGYMPVMIAYKPWKYLDAESCFGGRDFQNISGTINLYNFLTEHLNDNLLYQALVLQGADWQLSPWGTAGKLPALLGKDSYLLTIDRKRYSELKNTGDNWNRAFNQCGGRVHALECKTDKESILDACNKKGLFKPVPKSLKSKITILIPTHYVISCPGTKLIHTVLDSMARLPELDGCRVVIGYDVPDKNTAQHKEYARNLSNLGGKYQIEVMPIVGARQRKLFLSLIRECKTEYFLFWEHDWSWLRLPDMTGLVSLMDYDKKISAVYFSKRDNTVGAKMGDNSEILQDVHQCPVPLLKTNRWSNNPQLCRLSKWNEWAQIVESAPLAWPGQKPSKQIEPALHFRYLDEIKKDGFEKAHDRWGMYVYGKIGDKAMVHHLDGKVFK